MGESCPAGRGPALCLAVAVGAVLAVVVAGACSRSAGMTALGRNEQGYEEFLWLRDSSVMVRIPAGRFTMGSEHESREMPAREVHLNEYYIDKYPVTNRQYRRFCDATGRDYPSDPVWPGMENYFRRFPDYPVVNVSWEDARDYCSWAGKRLPTEAEWEKAARGVDGRTYPWGNSAPAGEHCNFADRSSSLPEADLGVDDGYRYTSPVGSYPAGASPYGVMDMAGNVWELCADWYQPDYYERAPARNPKGPPFGVARVRRGAAWNNEARRLRSSIRGWVLPSVSFDKLGFRACR